MLRKNLGLFLRLIFFLIISSESENYVGSCDRYRSAEAGREKSFADGEHRPAEEDQHDFVRQLFADARETQSEVDGH